MAFDEHALADACRAIVPAPGHAALLDAVGRVLPGYRFRRTLSRSGWYRLGGVVRDDGTRIADDLRDWAERECGGDAMELVARHADEGLLSTRLEGRTHYLVALLGDGAMNFIQLEVEETQELLDRALFTGDALPDNLDDVVNQIGFDRVEPKPLGPPRYRFSRITSIPEKMDDMLGGFGSEPSIKRFLSEWDDTSASAGGAFCSHWALRFFPFTDRFGESRLDAKPIPALFGDPMPVPEGGVDGGEKLARFVHSFDRAGGYPMAWYFRLVAGHKRMHRIAEGVLADHASGYAYLPDRDQAVLQRWARDPYCL
jgi:hypothetical protein